MPEITFRITNLSALLMNSPQAMARAAEGLGRKKVPKPEDEAESKAYRLPSGQLYLPSIQFRSSILNAVKGVRIGKTAARQVFSAALFVTEEFCPLELVVRLGCAVRVRSVASPS
jgi:hypothetical protein